MAQTKRKRRSKHRGNAAGTIETRGRTGRRPTAEERKKEDRAEARERRLNKPPSWSSSAKRASIAAVLMFAFLLITSTGKSFANRLVPAVVLAALAFALYVGLGFYMDQFLYRRRMNKKAAGK